jgi:hypothetical protein
MQVIEAQRASILEPHDHLHINQESASFGIPKVHRDSLAVSPFRSAQVREPDRPRQRCGDAVRVVRPYKDKVRAS